MSEIHVFFKKVNMREEVYDLLKTSFFKLFGKEAPNVFKDKNGKPYFDSKPDIHFSISHSGDYAMCAFSDNPIGADIQKIQEIFVFYPFFICDADTEWRNVLKKELAGIIRNRERGTKRAAL